MDTYRVCSPASQLARGDHRVSLERDAFDPTQETTRLILSLLLVLRKRSTLPLRTLLTTPFILQRWTILAARSYLSSDSGGHSRHLSLPGRPVTKPRYIRAALISML